MDEGGSAPSRAPEAPNALAMLPDAQRRVDACFAAEVGFWSDVYGQPTVEGHIFRDRETAVLKAIDRLALPHGAKVLEVGSGAGRVAVELRRRGFSVVAVDSVEAMATATRIAAQAVDGAAVPVAVTDAHALPMRANAFSLVLAIGVVPWLRDPIAALQEMRRVTSPGGSIVFTSDNRDRLPHLLDPRDNPYLGRVREWLKRRLSGLGLLAPRRSAEITNQRYFPRQVRAMAATAGIDVRASTTIGFGPFTFLGHALPLGPFGIRLHRCLQRLADAGVPVVRSTGTHQLVVGMNGVAVNGS